MNIKIIMTCILLLQSSWVFAEANILNGENEVKTILLTAPGTLSGDIHAPSEKTQLDVREDEGATNPFQQQRQYNFVNKDYFKFPQYGQVKGVNNPWTHDHSRHNMPPPLPPASRYSSNPWDLTGGHNPVSMDASKFEPNNVFNARMEPGFQFPISRPGNNYSNAVGPMYKDLPGGMFGDISPSSMPFMDGFMPGMGGDDFDFPFSPFSMF